MKTAIVTYSNGDKITTSINGSEEEIKKYFSIGKYFNIGCDKDNMQKVVSCEVLPCDNVLKQAKDLAIYSDAYSEAVMWGSKDLNTSMDDITHAIIYAKKVIEYHKEIASKYPANKWVKPTNNNSNDFDVFADLFEWGLIERKIEENYRGNPLVGTTQYFKHNF